MHKLWVLDGFKEDPIYKKKKDIYKKAMPL
jgi:hypothetical protein